MKNIAIIGLGYWGPNLLRNLYELNRCDRIIGCDIDQKKVSHIKNRYPTIEVEKDSEKVFESTDIEAVLIATPVSMLSLWLKSF